MIEIILYWILLSVAWVIFLYCMGLLGIQWYFQRRLNKDETRLEWTEHADNFYFD